MKKHKYKIISVILIAIALVFAYFYGVDAPESDYKLLQGEKKSDTVQSTEKESNTIKKSAQISEKKRKLRRTLFK